MFISHRICCIAASFPIHISLDFLLIPHSAFGVFPPFFGTIWGVEAITTTCLRVRILGFRDPKALPSCQLHISLLQASLSPLWTHQIPANLVGKCSSLLLCTNIWVYFGLLFFVFFLLFHPFFSFSLLLPLFYSYFFLFFFSSPTFSFSLFSPFLFLLSFFPPFPPLLLLSFFFLFFIFSPCLPFFSFFPILFLLLLLFSYFSSFILFSPFSSFLSLYVLLLSPFFSLFSFFLLFHPFFSFLLFFSPFFFIFPPFSPFLPFFLPPSFHYKQLWHLKLTEVFFIKSSVSSMNIKTSSLLCYCQDCLFHSKGNAHNG